MIRFLETPDQGVREEIERDLVRALAFARTFYGPSLVSLCLGGGYGRGEGGRRRADGRWRPENDYDLFAVVKGGAFAARSWRKRTHAELIPRLNLRQRMEYELGVLGERTLGRQPPSQMLYDLRSGHVCLWGDPEVLIELPDDAASIPPLDGLRLLVNRGALLLLAAEREGRGGALPAVNLERYLHKARLAVGDGWLLLQREHDHLLRRRAERVARSSLSGLPDAEFWREAHGAAAAKRLHGFEAPPSRGALEVELAELMPRYGRVLRAALEQVEGKRRFGRRERAHSLALELCRAFEPSRGVQDLRETAGTFLRRWRAGAA